jgi:hypothetical protein
LLLTAFPDLPEELATYVLQGLTRQFLLGNEYQMSAQDKIEARLVFAGYGSYEQTRLFMRDALAESSMLVAGRNIQEWFTRYENFQTTVESRKLQEFLLREVDKSSISEIDSQELEILLDVYREYLQYPVFNIYDATSFEVAATQAQRLDVLQKNNSLEKLTLLKALSKYSDIGSQVITEERLKLKGQVEPVRASLTNWLKVYRDELGIGHHDSVTRAKFLYESSNTKKLSPEDREKVHALVRSLEDEELLAIDTKSRTIIFTEEKKVATPNYSGGRNSAEAAPQDLFERFPGSKTPLKPASTLPTPLRSVGTSKFGAVTPRPEKTKEEQTSVLERIKKMNTVRLPEIPAHDQESSASRPLGKLTFSGSQVFSGETEQPIFIKPTTADPAFSTNKTFVPKEQPPSPWSEKKPAPPHAVSVQTFPVKGGAPAMPQQQTTASPKRASSPASVFRIKPNRE